MMNYTHTRTQPVSLGTKNPSCSNTLRKFSICAQSEQDSADSGEQQQLTWDWAMPRKAFAQAADLAQIKC